MSVSRFECLTPAPVNVDGQIILGHPVIAEKSNEIPAAQEMIAALGLSGRLFTLDAMHCQKTFQRARAIPGTICWSS